MATPLNVDSFSRYFMDLFDDTQMITAATGFQAFFARGTTVFSDSATAFDSDVMRGNKKIASLIPRSGSISRSLGSNQKTLKAGVWSNFTRTFPLSVELASIPADLLENRVPGEPPYARFPKQFRLKYYAIKEYDEMIRRKVDMFEVLAAQSMLTGVQDAIIGTSDTNEQYNWLRLAANTISVPVPWDGTTPDILGDVDSACIQVDRKGRAMPDIMCCGTTAWDALIQDTIVAAKADNRRYNLLSVSINNPVPKEMQFLIDAKWTSRGMLTTPEGYELWVFTYKGYYENSSGTPVDFMPKDKCMITSSGAKLDRLFGPPKTLDLTPTQIAWYQQRFGIAPNQARIPARASSGVIRPEMFHMDAYEDNDLSGVTLRGQSAPIFKTTQTDAVAVLTDLIT